jgi:hypothetical protein
MNPLGQITARLNPFSSTDYIDLLIESEQAETNLGWQVRVKHLQLAGCKAFAWKPKQKNHFRPLVNLHPKY